MIGGTKEGKKKNNILMTTLDNKNKFNFEVKEPKDENVTHEIITLRLNPAEDHFYAVVKSILKEVTETKDKKGKITEKSRFHIFKYKFTKDFKFELVQDYLCSKKGVGKDGDTIL